MPSIADLQEFVRINDLDSIKKTVAEGKISGLNWQYSKEYFLESAVRDAILLGQIETVRFFLEEGDVSENCRTPDDRGHCTLRLIYLAAKSNNLEMVELLVKHRATIKPRNDFLNEGDDSGMRGALDAGNVSIAEYLLKNGAAVDGMSYSGDFHSINFLAQAALDNNQGMIELLVQHKASVNQALERLLNQSESVRQSAENRERLRTAVLYLLDHAVGCDLYKNFLNDLAKWRVDITGFNFFGVSIGGHPLTRDRLEIYTLNKFDGAKRTIITASDLYTLLLGDDKRRKAIQARSVEKIRDEGGLVDEKTGVINFVPIWKAAEIGDVPAVKARLSAGVDPNARENPKSLAPIVLAVKNGHKEIAITLASHPKLHPETLLDAISAAKKNGRHELVNELTSYEEPNYQDEHGNTSLHRAVENGSLTETIINRLVNKGANFNIENRYGFTPLYQAAKAGSSKAVALLLPHTRKEDIIIGENKRFPWYVYLMFSSHKSKEWLNILVRLEKEGADLNARNKYGESLLDCEMREIAESPPYFSEYSHQFHFLLDHGVRVYKKGAEEVGTSLHSFMHQVSLYHADDIYSQVIPAFLKRGFDINSLDKNGDTLLHIAVFRKNVVAVKYLVALGARQDIKNNENQIPQDIASDKIRSILINTKFPQEGHEKASLETEKEKQNRIKIQYNNLKDFIIEFRSSLWFLPKFRDNFLGKLFKIQAVNYEIKEALDRRLAELQFKEVNNCGSDQLEEMAGEVVEQIKGYQRTLEKNRQHLFWKSQSRYLTELTDFLKPFELSSVESLQKEQILSSSFSDRRKSFLEKSNSLSDRVTLFPKPLELPSVESLQKQQISSSIPTQKK